jgi:hypothetical protein
MMPKPTPISQRLSPKEQSKRFRDKAKALIDAGELSLSDADKMLDRMVKESIKRYGA